MRLLIPHSLLKRSSRELAKTCLWKERDVENHTMTFPHHVKNAPRFPPSHRLDYSDLFLSSYSFPEVLLRRGYRRR